MSSAVVLAALAAPTASATTEEGVTAAAHTHIATHWDWRYLVLLGETGLKAKLQEEEKGGGWTL